MLANRKILGLGFQEYFFHDMPAGEQKYFSGILCQQQNCIYFFFQAQGHQMYVILVSHIQQMLI